MLKDFNGHTFKPHGIIPSFYVELGGNTVEIEVEVGDAPLDFNLFLSHSWTYAMKFVVLSI